MISSLRKTALDYCLARVLVRVSTKARLHVADGSGWSWPRAAEVATFGVLGTMTAAAVMANWAPSSVVECESSRRRGSSSFHLAFEDLGTFSKGGRWVEVGDGSSFQPGETYELVVEEGHSVRV